MEDHKSIATRGTRPGRTKTQKPACRICLKKAKKMVNIFDICPEFAVSVADMISQCTGHRVFKGDTLPETVCSACLQDTRTTFRISLTHEQIGFQVKEEDVENSQEEPQMEYFQIDEFLSEEVKNEPMEDYVPGEVMMPVEEEYLPAQVINEPIEDDSLEDNIDQSLDYEIDPSYLRGNDTNNDKQSPKKRVTKSVKPKSMKPKSVMPKSLTDDIPFQCSLCPRLFPTLPKLKAHEFRHKQPTYKCTYCDAVFTYQSALTQHIRFHTGEKPFKCSQCQKEFTTQTQFSLHFKSHPPIPIFKCSHCELAFASENELEEHLNSHMKNRCSYCQRDFQNAKALKNHVTFNHLQKGNYKCSNCHIEYNSFRNLKKHYKDTHKEKVRKPTYKKDTKLKLPPLKHFHCSYCEKSFARNQSLVLHVKYKHPDQVFFPTSNPLH